MKKISLLIALSILFKFSSMAQLCNLPVVDGSGNIVRSFNGAPVVTGDLVECDPTVLVVEVTYVTTYEPYDYEALDYETKLSLERATETIFFDLDKAEIKREGKAILQDIAKAMEKTNQYDLVIVGHADQSGSDSYNYDLAKERAENVFRFLTKSGVSSNRLNVKSYGEDKPISPNPEYNRRVEFVVTK